MQLLAVAAVPDLITPSTRPRNDGARNAKSDDDGVSTKDNAASILKKKKQHQVVNSYDNVKGLRLPTSSSKHLGIQEPVMTIQMQT